MADWAGWLNSHAGRPVLDRTGLAGEFRFHLEADDKGSVRPRLIDAIQAIGLKLEEARVPVEVLVIESAERPTQN
jgi:uncharacterized protein (TIGR03435 family)